MIVADAQYINYFSSLSKYVYDVKVIMHPKKVNLVDLKDLSPYTKHFSIFLIGISNLMFLQCDEPIFCFYFVKCLVRFLHSDLLPSGLFTVTTIVSSAHRIKGKDQKLIRSIITLYLHFSDSSCFWP